MRSPDSPVELGLGELVEAARALAADGRRRILGIAGAPGAGKSTLARQVADALGDRAALVGLDGFHLSNAELHRLGRHARKGAADTFDAAGYRSLLRRLRPQHDEIVYAAEFDRGLEESIACAVPVHRTVPLIITEGNYLLVDDDRWGGIAELLDQSWYVEPGEDLRLARLIERHVRFGRSPEEAAERSHGSDQRNAELIEGTRHRAGLVVRVTGPAA
ncbi:nucleoside/nucleotide kinase family protein [Amorphoplanes digitatis]|uniref:Pantothenate kinase n=1 Tax=Actinoplanes digitatis TaxID=1868 RepID=A0A7W7HZX4_9ACTN|nr:nucleoside/nucleotide kinase family protein [Actinoplanes digitatis]MBB4763831.1 pantothenate kinase [Actinoplanes digitatis]GID95689.1 nucleoside/nucleotide kinase family protein [Actinoplanes digitatis]